MEMGVSIQDAADELLDTKIFKAAAERNGDNFAIKLALWIVRYILVICSMKQTLNISLDSILSRLHGEDNFKRIFEITENMFCKVFEQLNKKC